MDETLQQGNVNFVTCTKWIKKGVAKSNPEKVKLTKDELLEVIRDTKERLRLSQNQPGTDANRAHGEASQQDEFDLDNYDEDDGSADNALALGAHAELQGNRDDDFIDSDDSDREDEIIKSSDNLILVGHVEGDVSSLEVYVYNEEEEALYVHHDILLPSFPLCFEWLDYEPNAPKGNYCAVGSMSPSIQIWDLDLINCIEPAFTLGKKASVRKGRPRIGHSDAVLALSWNRKYEHILASGSVDRSVILWDMESKTPSTTIEAFNEKVQCLEWHPLEVQTLLAGAADKTAKIFDCLAPDAHQTWELNGEAEILHWNPQQPFMFYAGTNVGSLQCFDCRRGLLWTVQAHEKEITGLVVSSQCAGLLATASPDGLVKIWDCNSTSSGNSNDVINTPSEASASNDVSAEDASPSAAVLVAEQNFNLGQIQCLDVSPDSPFVLSVGGDNKSNNFKVFDLRNIDAVKHKFENRELVHLIPNDGSGSSAME